MVQNVILSLLHSIEKVEFYESVVPFCKDEDKESSRKNFGFRLQVVDLDLVERPAADLGGRKANLRSSVPVLFCLLLLLPSVLSTAGGMSFVDTCSLGPPEAFTDFKHSM